MGSVLSFDFKNMIETEEELKKFSKILIKYKEKDTRNAKANDLKIRFHDKIYVIDYEDEELKECDEKTSKAAWKSMEEVNHFISYSHEYIDKKLFLQDFPEILLPTLKWDLMGIQKESDFYFEKTYKYTFHYQLDRITKKMLNRASRHNLLLNYG